VRPIGELLLKDSFRVLRVLAALTQVPLGEILDQCRHVVGILRGSVELQKLNRAMQVALAELQAKKPPVAMR